MSKSEISFPPDFFEPPSERPDCWQGLSDVRRAVNWFRSFIPTHEWEARRERIARRHYEALLGKAASSDGRFFDARDRFGWYLFQAEAFLDYIYCYDVLFGARVVPIFDSIGRNLDLIQKIPGIDGRVKELIAGKKAQPNGVLFEILVAACYCRAGGEVAFVEEAPGVAKRHDMNVLLNGKEWAVECKRLEMSAYGDKERGHLNRIWGPSAALLQGLGQNTLCEAEFNVELLDVPDAYLFEKVKAWLGSPGTPTSWK